MKKLLKLSALIALSLGFVACSDDDNTQPQEPVTLLTKIEETSVNGYGGSVGYSSVTTITYNDQNQIVKIQSDATMTENYSSEQKFYYSNGKLIGSSHVDVDYVGLSYSSMDKDSSKVETDTQGRVTKATFYNDSNNFSTPYAINVYTWTGDRVSEVKDLIDNKAYAITYSNGNIAILQDNTVGSMMKYTATFDNKKNFNATMLNYLLASFDKVPDFIGYPEDDDILSYFNTNNIIQSKLEVENYSGNNNVSNYIYEYNADGYVTKSTTTATRSAGSTSTTVYTYIKK